MVDGFRDEDLAPFVEDAMQQGRSAPAFLLAQHADLIAAVIGRITRHRILPQVFRGHQNIQMRPRRPVRQRDAIHAAEFIFADTIGHFLDPGQFHLNDRRIGIVGIAMHHRSIAFGLAFAVFAGGDHGLIRLDPGFAIHREWIRVGVWGQWGRVHGQRLIFVFQVQIGLQAALVHRVFGRAIAAAFVQLDIPPPFLDRVELTMPHLVVQPSQHRRGGGYV